MSRNYFILGYDSSVLELAYRKTLGLTLDSGMLKWCKEEKKPADQEGTSKENDLKMHSCVIILNGLYQLNFNPSNNDRSSSEQASKEASSDFFLEPIYWKEDVIMKVRRGTWFVSDSMQPLPSDLADAIEKRHLESFRGQVIPDSPVFSEAESSKKPCKLKFLCNCVNINLMLLYLNNLIV